VARVLLDTGAMRLSDLDKLTVGDLRTLLTIKRLGSMSGAARELRVTPSQVSKAACRVEAIVGRTLLVRGRRGVTLSGDAVGLLPQLEQVYERLVEAIQGETAFQVITIAAPPYLQSTFLPAIAAALPDFCVRGLEMAPALVRAHATDNLFDAALLVGTSHLGPGWESEHVADLRLALYASPEVVASLGPEPVLPTRLAGTPFVAPVYLANGQFLSVDDGCPLARRLRKKGCEVQSVGLALEVAAQTGQLVYGPTIAASRFVKEGTLRQVQVAGWAVTKALYLVCHGERLRARAHRTILEQMRAVLALHDAEASPPVPLPLQDRRHLGGKASTVPLVHDEGRKDAETTPIAQDRLHEHAPGRLASHAVDRAQTARHQLAARQRGKEVGQSIRRKHRRDATEGA
jgi:DNA-binding transcriptional LysR family regulator